jgi:hypothetical protein
MKHWSSIPVSVYTYQVCCAQRHLKSKLILSRKPNPIISPFYFAVQYTDLAAPASPHQSVSQGCSPWILNWVGSSSLGWGECCWHFMEKGQGQTLCAAMLRTVLQKNCPVLPQMPLCPKAKKMKVLVIWFSTGPWVLLPSFRVWCKDFQFEAICQSHTRQPKGELYRLTLHKYS